MIIIIYYPIILFLSDKIFTKIFTKKEIDNIIINTIKN